MRVRERERGRELRNVKARRQDKTIEDKTDRGRYRARTALYVPDIKAAMFITL